MRPQAIITCRENGDVVYEGRFKATFSDLTSAIDTAISNFPGVPVNLGLIIALRRYGDIIIRGSECAVNSTINLNVVDVKLTSEATLVCKTVPCIYIPAITEPISRRTYAPSTVRLLNLDMVYVGDASDSEVLANYGASTFIARNIMIDGSSKAGFGFVATPARISTVDIQNVVVSRVRYAGVVVRSRIHYSIRGVTVRSVRNADDNGVGLMISSYANGYIGDLEIRGCDIGLGVYSAAKPIMINGVDFSQNSKHVMNASRQKLIMYGVKVDSVPVGDDIITSKVEAWGPGFVNFGTQTFTADGTTTTFQIAHGLYAQPRVVNVTPSGNTPVGYTVTADDTYITITYETAPASGTVLTFWWFARV